MARSIVHPGPRNGIRRVVLRGWAEAANPELVAGATLRDALADVMATSGADSAVAVLDGLAIAEGEYVMPARATDGVHAAWYSPARPTGAVRIEHAVATVGEKDGRPFVHCHALWTGPDGPRMGHLLNETVRIAAPERIRAWLFHGGHLVVRPDAETGFPLFVPEGAGGEGNAALVTVRPHEDLCAGLADAAAEAEFREADAVGLGSLIGARFADAPPMDDPISEMLLLPGARVAAGRRRTLPVAAVDLVGRVHRGELRSAPICVTGEFLLIDQSGSPQPGQALGHTRAQNSG